MREWKNIDKSTWPRGEWDREPDKRQWRDPDTGLPCLAVRHPSMGHWCGYVGVYPDHPAYQLHYDGITQMDAERNKERWDLRTKLWMDAGQPNFQSEESKAIDDQVDKQIGPRIEANINTLDGIEVHGGLTFADACKPGEYEGEGICHVPDPGEPEVWWFGFDCAHCYDFSPNLDLGRKPFRESEYRDIHYVEDECKRLARQLKDIKP